MWDELSNIPSKGVEQKEMEGTQRFLKGGKLGHGVGALKRGAGTPLQTMYNQFLLLKNYRLWH